MRLRPISILTNLRRLLELSLRQIRLYFRLFHVPSCHLCPFPFLHRPYLVHGRRLGL